MRPWRMLMAYTKKREQLIAAADAEGKTRLKGLFDALEKCQAEQHVQALTALHKLLVSYEEVVELAGDLSTTIANEKWRMRFVTENARSWEGYEEGLAKERPKN